MLAGLLSNEAFAFLLVLTRVTMAIMLFSGFSDSYVSSRIRLLFSVAMTVVVLPVLTPILPPLPASPLEIAVLLVGELIIGFFIGTVSRMIVLALEIGGTLASMMTSLASAQIFNPSVAVQGSVISSFFLTLGVTLLFATDLHHLMLMAVVNSYKLFPPGQMPPIDDMSHAIARLAADGLSIGLELTAPFVVVGLLIYSAMGLMARLMPQMMIFFVALPAQIVAGISVLLVVFSSVMLVWLDHYETTFIDLFG